MEQNRQGALSDTILWNVEEEDTAWKAWSKLEDSYAQQSVATKLYWLQKLVSLKMKEGKTSKVKSHKKDRYLKPWFKLWSTT